MIHGDSELFEIDIVFSEGRRAGLNTRDDRVVCFFGAKAADQRPAPAIQFNGAIRGKTRSCSHWYFLLLFIG